MCRNVNLLFSSPHVQFCSTLLMLCTSDIYTLITYVGFINYFFYGLTIAGLILLRIREPDLYRPFKVKTFRPNFNLIHNQWPTFKNQHAPRWVAHFLSVLLHMWFASSSSTRWTWYGRCSTCWSGPSCWSSPSTLSLSSAVLVWLSCWPVSPYISWESIGKTSHSVWILLLVRAMFLGSCIKLNVIGSLLAAGGTPPPRSERSGVPR